MFDIQQIRKDTPACEDKLFFNSAGASLTPSSVNQKVIEYLQAEEEIGGYQLADQRIDQVESFYSQVAGLLNTKAKNISFAHHATDAYAKALSSIPFQSGDVILTTNDDYVSNYLNFISLKKHLGIRIVRADNLENGDIDLEGFGRLLQKYQPRLVAITHIPTSSGLVQDVEAIGQLCKERNILFLLDACQSVGQLEVDVQKIGCDYLSATGRKFLRGPRGTGFLYVSDRVLEEGYAPLYVDLRGAEWVGEEAFELRPDARRFETWEMPYALLVGLTEAIAYARQVGIKKIQAYNKRLVTHLNSQLNDVKGLSLYDRGSVRAAILTLCKTDKSLVQTKAYLDQHNVYYSVIDKSSARWDFEEKKIDWAIRISPHYFNTIDEANQLAELLKAF